MATAPRVHPRNPVLVPVCAGTFKSLDRTSSSLGQVSGDRPPEIQNVYASPPPAPTRGERDLHARPHRRGQRNLLHIGALGARRLGLDHAVDEGSHICDDGVLGEARLADAGLHDARLLDAEFHRAALGVLDRLGDVHRHRADLRVGHQVARTQHLSEPADNAHHVGRGDAAVEIDLALADLLGQILGADDVGARLFGFFGLGALGENRDAQACGPCRWAARRRRAPSDRHGADRRRD